MSKIPSKRFENIWRLMLAGALMGGLFRTLMGAPREADPELYRPQWKVGQAWIVETISLQSQARHNVEAETSSPPVRWRFNVQQIVKVDQRDSFEVQVQCLVGDVHPITTLWVDQQTMTLRRVQTQVPLSGGFRTVTESYRSASGQPFPAFAPLTIPPLELPLFLKGTKGSQVFTYVATSDPTGVKAVGDLDFAFSVEQRVTEPDAEAVKDLLPQAYTKDLARKPTVEVRLQVAGSKVRQLWHPGVPWPVYSNNGLAEARLIKVMDAPQPP